MSGPESITPKRINASELVNLLAQAGPAFNIRVRIYFKDGSMKGGIVKWRDDRINSGPVIVIPDKDPFNEALIPLGGHTVYNAPPRVSSSDSGRNRPPMFGEVSAHKVPINSSTEGILFEVINKK
ncbi:hypothetical protein A3A05_02575 [Candidatus Nomurabacteria bacterium RIFCSPLOWO2_01_FULL_41_12]|uniref:Uncharacterized protein n=1 Tax=Candidatus Nomurabacteria bacterium RIFCSPLOWO2_01_FULL_41_12 TaxID=1801774 RepID=A0A1F6WVY1_9BACT|nr:MAG: hypothetical protein A2732_00685 [Candidatus Nomurabacteria bacterium RIFCSPHIGHO2_01_FULL_40_10]OGI85974.1 MAG: hypothetical protein A3A05_02575 [Candidatus Nomurabacteria bacterium RIFCSPLOWO2_01_FULL_41_12]